MQNQKTEEIEKTESNFIDPIKLVGKKKFVHAVLVESKPEKKQINTVWVPTGRTVTKTTLMFSDGTWSTSKSINWLVVFGNTTGVTDMIPSGFKRVINAEYEFFLTPTEYGNGRMYDVIDAKRVEPVQTTFER